MANRTRSTNDPLDFLFVHVPKASNYYPLLDEFVSINYLPMGVFGLCDLLNRNGTSSGILHLGLETILDRDFSIARHVEERAIPWVGMSLHWHYQAFDVIDVAQKIKARSPRTKIVLGGFTATRFAREILADHPEIDCVLQGDSEKGILELARAWRGGDRDLSAVSNCAWRREGAVVDNGITYVADAASLEGIDYAHLELLSHFEQYRDYYKAPFIWPVNASIEENTKRRVGGAATVFPLLVGRGCPVDCSFCGGSRSAQRRLCGRKVSFFRRRPGAVVDTMERAIAQGYESFIVCFDPTPANDAYYLELFAEVRRRGLRCGMGFEAWGLPTRALIRDFRETFVREASYVALSPETGSEEIRKRNKGFFYTNDRLHEVMGWLEEEGVPAVVYLACGLPGETSAHLEETHAFAADLRRRYPRILSNVLLFPVQIEPGAPLFEEPDAHGVVTSRRGFRDFLEHHGNPGQEPYAELGYATDALVEAGADVGRFTEYLRQMRCDRFCLVEPKLLGMRLPNVFGKAWCSLRHGMWKRKGFGERPRERATFR